LASGQALVFCALLFSLVARTIVLGGMRTLVCSPVSICIASPGPVQPHCLATKSEPKSDSCTTLHPSAHTFTRVLTNVGVLTSLLCTAATSSPGVGATVPAMASTSLRQTPPS
jgi:hypothetical protein